MLVLSFLFLFLVPSKFLIVYYYYITVVPIFPHLSYSIHPMPPLPWSIPIPLSIYMDPSCVLFDYFLSFFPPPLSPVVPVSHFHVSMYLV